MTDIRHFGMREFLLWGLVVVVAAGARAGYLWAYADAGGDRGPLMVDRRLLETLPSEPGMRDLVIQLGQQNGFKGRSPFAADPELTAHTAPGYPWLLSMVERGAGHDYDPTMRWLQCGLGALTAGFYFLFARRAFRHLGVATVAGLFCALHPFWVINTAAVEEGGDAVVASFLLSFVLWLGSRAGQQGGAADSLIFGLGLAALALVRAALTPFAFVAVAWFLLRSRQLASGWLYGLLAFLGFVIGLAPWVVRNFQVFGEPVPVVDTAPLHLWIGNNPHATGGPYVGRTMFDRGLVNELAKIPAERQPERYAELGKRAWEYIVEHPVEAMQLRIHAALAFFLGDSWLSNGTLAEPITRAVPMPEGLARWYAWILQLTLLVMLGLALLGWRWTYGWSWEAMPSSLALIWIPLPYILTHAEALSGPRLPLDGLLLTYAAFALVCLIPVVNRPLLQGSDRRRAEEKAAGV
jgi:hypothetical protein